MKAEWLRRIAFAGAVLIVVGQTVEHFPNEGMRVFWSLAFFVLAIVAVAGAVFVLAPWSFERLRRHPDLLVPLGFLILASGLLGWLARVPGLTTILTGSYTPTIGNFSLATLSLVFVLYLLLAVSYATWATLMVVSAVRDDRTDAAAALGEVGRHFLRILAMACLGWGVMYLVMLATLALVSVVGVPVAAQLGWAGRLVIWAALTGCGAIGVLWNLASAAWLPVGLDRRRGLAVSLGAGTRLSWATKSRWWTLVVAQMLLLGYWAFLNYQYTSSHVASPGGVNESFSVNFNYRFYFFWIGGYEHGCRWYGEFMKLAGHLPVPVMNTLLALPFGVLALCVKLRIVEALQKLSSSEIEDPAVVT